MECLKEHNHKPFTNPQNTKNGEANSHYLLINSASDLLISSASITICPTVTQLGQTLHCSTWIQGLTIGQSLPSNTLHETLLRRLRSVISQYLEPLSSYSFWKWFPRRWSATPQMLSWSSMQPLRNLSTVTAYWCPSLQHLWLNLIHTLNPATGMFFDSLSVPCHGNDLIFLSPPQTLSLQRQTWCLA